MSPLPARRPLTLVPLVRNSTRASDSRRSPSIRSPIPQPLEPAACLYWPYPNASPMLSH